MDNFSLILYRSIKESPTKPDVTSSGSTEQGTVTPNVRFTDNTVRSDENYEV